MTTSPVTLTFRDAIKRISPRWLQGPLGERLLYSLAVQIDALGDGTVAGVKARFPGLYTDETLPILGRDRRILQGPDEPNANFADRLRFWLDSHRTAGNPFTLMAQIRGYFAPAAFKIVCVNNDGARFTLDADGSIAVDSITWNWDNDSTLWSRFWVILYPDPSVIDDDGVSGDPGNLGDGGAIGSDASLAVVDAVRGLVRQWRSGTSIAANVIIVHDETAWDADQPDGTRDWNRWRNRNPAASYWDGV